MRTFKVVFAKAITIAKAADAEHSLLRGRFRSERDPEYLGTPRRSREALTNYLFQQDGVHLSKLETLLCVGLGECDDVLANHRAVVVRDHSRHAIVQLLMAQQPLAPCLLRGYEIATEAGLDFEGDWIIDATDAESGVTSKADDPETHLLGRMIS